MMPSVRDTAADGILELYSSVPKRVLPWKSIYFMLVAHDVISICLNTHWDALTLITLTVRLRTRVYY